MAMTFKERVDARLGDWPLLRVLLYSFWFRLVFLVTVAAVALFGVSLLKVWRTTPPGFEPETRVSGVDLIQAWSLERAARDYAAQGRNEEAVRSWLIASANNKGDAEMLRRLVRFATDVDHLQPEWAGAVLAQAGWLLRLAGTNQADLELSIRLFTRYDEPDWVARQLDPLKDRLPPGMEASYLRALFSLRRMDDFGKRWARLTPEVAADPELSLYYAAYQIAWGPPGNMDQARRMLQVAGEDPKREVLACRLQLAVASKAVDAAGYARALNRLEQRQMARLQDRTAYWQLLVTTGQRQEAVRLAEGYVEAPAQAADVIVLAEAYVGMDMPDLAKKVIRRYTPQLSSDASDVAVRLWTLYADLIVKRRHWDELRTTALEIRMHEQLRPWLAGFSFFLQGRAEVGQDRPEAARAAFQEAVQQPVLHTGLSLQVALGILQAGEPDLALILLTRLEPKLEREMPYWRFVIDAANAARDADALLKAAAKACELAPDDRINQNNYAAALLTHRAKPDEACRLTLRVYQTAPNSVPAMINHAYALTVSHRYDEAEAILARLKLDKLSAEELTNYHFNWFELALVRGDFPRAKQELEQIDRRFLFPPQTRWLEEQHKRLEAVTGGSSQAG
jgi:hypothetical protein